MRWKMSSNPKRPHSSRQTVLLLVTGLAALGLFAFVSCTQNLMVGSSTMSDLHPGLLDAGFTGGTTGNGSCTPGCTGLACSGTGGAPGAGTGGAGAGVASCMTISTTPGTLNACGLTFGIAYSPDGQLIATATETGSPNIHVWRLSVELC